MALAIDTYHVKIKLAEDMLGTVPKNKEVYTKFIADRAREHVEQAQKKGHDAFTPGDQAAISPETLAKMAEDEIGSIKEMEERGWTGFRIDEETGKPFMYSYML